jgi:superfamily II DNA or RNA helicase
MQESHTPLSAGHAVVVRDERWTVVGIDRFDHVVLVRLRGTQDGNYDQLAAVLTPADVVQPLPARNRLRQRSRRAVLAAAASSIEENASWDQCWTAGRARIDPHPWQLEPACAAVTGTMRIMLADEVGMGKTIQAALIITELRARGLAERALVLTPASIREQWAGELRDRFGLAAAVFDQSTLAVTMATLPPEVNPWITEPLIISSIDLVKRPEVRAALESVPFDVLVVDEAHHVAPGTDRAAVVAELAQRTPWVVLATATPHDGNDGAFHYLQRLGDVGADEMRTFRRSRRAGFGITARRSRLLFVQPTTAERALLDLTREYARALKTRGAGPPAQLIASVVARRAASSAQAVHGTFLRRIALLARDSEPERQVPLPWEDEDLDTISDAVLATPGLRDVGREIDWLYRLADLAEAARSHSSKVSVIRRLLRRTDEQLLVFSEYRDVAQSVAAALGERSTVATLHGGLSTRQRGEVVYAFNSGRVRVLVATDAAGEGLNLQARCRLVVNMELPWAPRRLEQRIGRVDRLGQQRRVHAIHLAHQDSYEATVIARLERRRARVLSQARPAVATHDDRSPGLTRAPQPLAVDRDGERFTGGVYASRGRSASGRLRLVYRVTAVDGRGRLVQRATAARQVECAPWRHRRLSRALVREMVASDQVRQSLELQVRSLMSSVSDTTTPSAAAMQRRMTALASHFDRLSSSGIWQGSLFDRRNEQRAHARRSSIARLERHLGDLATSVGALGQITIQEPQLVAAWLE